MANIIKKLLSRFNATTNNLTEQQTDSAQLGHLHSHYSDHPSSGLTPAKLAEIMRAAEQGQIMSQCELAEDIEEKDAHVFSELQKRRRALLGVDWKIKPPRNASAGEIKDAEMLQELFEDMTFLDDVIFDMSDGILKGFSNQEISWQKNQGIWLPSELEFMDPSWFMTVTDIREGEHRISRNELRLRDNSEYGAALQPLGWLSHVHKTKSGYLSRNGLARVLFWPHLFKNFSTRDLAEFIEIYGLPLRLGKYPNGATPDEKSTLLRAVMSIGHNAGGIIPKGMELEFNEAAKGTHQPFEFMMNFMEKSQSKAILGGTLTSQADGKSSTNALGNVHNEVRQELRDSDLKQIAASITRDLAVPIYALNGKSFTEPGRSPSFEFDITEPEDLTNYAESLPKLVGVGMQVPVSWAHGKLQIPEPKDGEAVLAAAAADKPPVEQKEPQPKEIKSKQQAAAKHKAISKIVALKAKSTSDKDVADLYSDQLANNFSPVLKGFTDDIQKLVDSAESLEELQATLAEHELSIDEASEVLQQALVASELAGIEDVNKESEVN